MTYFDFWKTIYR